MRMRGRGFGQGLPSPSRRAWVVPDPEKPADSRPDPKAGDRSAQPGYSGLRCSLCKETGCAKRNGPSDISGQTMSGVRHVLNQIEWKSALGELALIVVGILAAFAVNAWWDDRQEAA